MAALATSSPYRWPWHGRFQASRTAVVVAHDGSGPMPPGAPWDRLEALMARARSAALALVGLPHVNCPPAGVLDPRNLTFVVARPHVGGFSGTDLDFQLRCRGIECLVFAGSPFEIGADTTMRQANDLGYECLALTDCCTGVTAETLAGAFHSIEMSGGIFGAIATSESFLALIDAPATSPTKDEETE